MALIKCSECGKEISDKAKTCPNCGNYNNKANKKRDYIIIGICIASIILLIIGGIVFVRIGSVTYKYSRAAIEILEQYKNDKVDEEEVMKKLSRFKEELEEIQTEGDDSKILSLKTDIFSIYTDFLVDKVTLSELDNYIFELKTRY